MTNANVKNILTAKKTGAAVGLLAASVALTFGYQYMAGWESPVNLIGAGIVVGSWLAVLHYSPVLIGFVRELLSPVWEGVLISTGSAFRKFGGLSMGRTQCSQERAPFSPRFYVVSAKRFRTAIEAAVKAFDALRAALWTNSSKAG